LFSPNELLSYIIHNFLMKIKYEYQKKLIKCHFFFLCAKNIYKKYQNMVAF